MNKRIATLCFASAIAACSGDDGAPGPQGDRGQPGATGAAGADGDSCTVDASTTPPSLRCEDGTSTPIGVEGGCSVVVVPGGVDIVCPDGGRFFVPASPVDEASEPEVRLLAGVSSVGNADGVGPEARMDGALTGALDSEGDFIYLVDSFNGTIRRYGIASRRVTTLAGQPGVEGISDGIGTEATFENPRGLAYDGERGLLYINDGFNCTLRTLDIATREVQTIGGEAGVCDVNQDGPLGEGPDTARFRLIIGSAMGPNGRYLYLSDRGTQSIRRVDLETQVVETWAGPPPDVAEPRRGTNDGTGDAARFNGPGGIAFDESGQYLFINDTFNGTIRRLDMQTREVVTIAGSAGETSDNIDGIGEAARFSVSQGLTYFGETLYVAGFHGSVRAIDVSDPEASAQVTTIAGSNGTGGSADGSFALARFGVAFGIIADPARNTIYYFDRGNNNIRALDLARETVTTVMGPQSPVGFVDGPTGTSRFNSPSAVAATEDGLTYYVADVGNAVIRAFDVRTGRLDTLSGLPGRFGDRDGDFDATLYETLNDIALSADEQTLYIADGGNGTLRALTIATTEAVTLSGRMAEDADSAEDGALADATFGNPRGLAVSHDGNTLYISDSEFGNIRIVDLSTEQVTTLEPQQRNESDELVALELGSPRGLTLNADETALYIADATRGVVWSVELADPNLAAVAGGVLDESGSIDGPRGEGTLAFPIDVLLTPDGQGLLVSDSLSFAMRRLDLETGALSTSVGQLGLSGGVSGLAEPLASARLYFPDQLAWAGDDTLVFTADEGLFQVVFSDDQRPN